MTVVSLSAVHLVTVGLDADPKTVATTARAAATAWAAEHGLLLAAPPAVSGTRWAGTCWEVDLVLHTTLPAPAAPLPRAALAGVAVVPPRVGAA